MKRLIQSFKYALEGLFTALRQERNMKIHTVAGVIAALCGFYFHLSVTEWLVLTLTIAGVFTAELLNTAIERTVDLYGRDFHPLAKQAKDIAAGACFISALASVIVGMLIFGPKIFYMFSGLGIF